MEGNAVYTNGDVIIIALTLIILAGIWSFTIIVLRSNKMREKDQ